jgi:hypothetical protein
MTPHERQRVALAPELAVIYALRAAADATCAALAAAHPFAQSQPPSHEEMLTAGLHDALRRLDRAAAAYCDYLLDLPQLRFVVMPGELPF